MLLLMCVRQRYMDERKFMVTSIVKHCMCRLHKIYVDFARLHGVTLCIVLNRCSYVLFRSSFSHLFDVWWMNNNRRFNSGMCVCVCVNAREHSRKLLWCKIYFSWSIRMLCEIMSICGCICGVFVCLCDGSFSVLMHTDHSVDREEKLGMVRWSSV